MYHLSIFKSNFYIQPYHVQARHARMEGLVIMMPEEQDSLANVLQLTWDPFAKYVSPWKVLIPLLLSFL